MTQKLKLEIYLDYQLKRDRDNREKKNTIGKNDKQTTAIREIKTG